MGYRKQVLSVIDMSFGDLSLELVCLIFGALKWATENKY